VTFDPSVVAAVTSHMNLDHPDDNLLIARAFGHADATAATMTDVHEAVGTWSVTTPGGERSLDVPWPGGPITERAEVRREVVALYDAACSALGVPARPH
jgi:heme oxygenase (biliverdin-producing, ferredoxin)